MFCDIKDIIYTHASAMLFFILVIASTAILSFFAGNTFWRRNYRRRPTSNVNVMFPYPPQIMESRRWTCPIFGHIRRLGDSPHRNLAELDHRQGSVGIMSLQLASKRAVVINGSTVIRLVAGRRPIGPRVQSPFDDRPDFDAYRQYASGRSISFARDGPVMRAHRKVAAATIAQLIGAGGTAEEILRREADKLVGVWLGSDDTEGGVPTRHRNSFEGFDPSKDVQEAICSALYSMCYGLDERLKDNEEYYDLLMGENPGTELFAIGRQPDLFPFWVRHFVIDDRKHRDHFRRMSTHVRLNDDMSRRLLSCPPADDSAYDDVTVSDKCHVMNSAINEWQRGAEKLRSIGLTREHLTGLPVEFLSAGSETSSASILWLLQLMALHTEIQNRVHEEIDRQLEPGHVISFTDRHRLPLTEAVILESFRLVPVVPLGLPHYSRHDYQLDLNQNVTQTGDTKSTEHGQFTIPADTLIFTNLWSTGHDPEIWNNPGQFNPDRFLMSPRFCPLDVSSNLNDPTAPNQLQTSLSHRVTGEDSIATATTNSSASAPFHADGEDGAIKHLNIPNSSSTECKRVDAASLVADVKRQGDDVTGTSNGRDSDVILNRKLSNLCCPFGVGRRRCVGEPLGRLQVFMIFVTVMRSFRIEMLSPPGVQERNVAALEAFGDVIRPKPFKIRIFERQTSL